jgi:hypothetical protein
VDLALVRCKNAFLHGELVDYISYEDTRERQIGDQFCDRRGEEYHPPMVRTLISNVVNFRWTSHRLDVKNAFLHGDLADYISYEDPRERQIGDQFCDRRGEEHDPPVG